MSLKFSLQGFVEKKFKENRLLVKKIKKLTKKIGFNSEQWIRYPAYKLIKKKLLTYPINTFETLEISAGEYWKENFKFKNYTEFNFPRNDICRQLKLKKKFDLIIADNVWEHLEYPYRATKNIYKLLKPRGIFLVITPFLIRIHNIPNDCTRWTKEGLKYLLIESGFKTNKIVTHSWGNRSCVISNLRTDDSWTRVGFYKDFKNDDLFPVQIWAFAQK
jgi:SAM-dependent methyltransferase